MDFDHFDDLTDLSDCLHTPSRIKAIGNCVLRVDPNEGDDLRLDLIIGISVEMPNFPVCTIVVPLLNPKQNSIAMLMMSARRFVEYCLRDMLNDPRHMLHDSYPAFQPAGLANFVGDSDRIPKTELTVVWGASAADLAQEASKHIQLHRESRFDHDN